MWIGSNVLLSFCRSRLPAENRCRCPVTPTKKLLHGRNVEPHPSPPHRQFLRPRSCAVRQVREYLEKNYAETGGNDTVKLALRALTETVEAGSKNIEVAVISRDTGAGTVHGRCALPGLLPRRYPLRHVSGRARSGPEHLCIERIIVDISTRRCCARMWILFSTIGRSGDNPGCSAQSARKTSQITWCRLGTQPASGCVACVQA